MTFLRTYGAISGHPSVVRHYFLTFTASKYNFTEKGHSDELSLVNERNAMQYNIETIRFIIDLIANSQEIRSNRTTAIVFMNPSSLSRKSNAVLV